jgi:hypothetical protein
MAPLTPVVEVFETILALVYIPAVVILVVMGASVPVFVIEWLLPVSTMGAAKAWVLAVILLLSVVFFAVSMWSLFAVVFLPV